MSMFTVETPYYGQVVCPRCHRAQFVKLIRREQGHEVYDCTRCGPIPQKKNGRPE